MPRTKALHIHTVMGPIVASNMTHARALLEDIAMDAVRMGRGTEQPWIVDDRGKPLRALSQYTMLLGPRSLTGYRGDLSPPARGQNSTLAGVLMAAEEFEGHLWKLHEVKHSRIIDPVAKALLAAHVRRVVVPLLETLDGCEPLVEQLLSLYPHGKIGEDAEGDD